MKRHLIIIFSATSLLQNCAPTNLYVAHDTILGVNAKVNQGRQQGQLAIGYDRDFATVIPRSVEPTDGTSGLDAMSLVHCSNVRVDGIYLGEYSDFTATGTAASNIAANKFKIEAATSCASLTATEKAEGTG